MLPQIFAVRDASFAEYRVALCPVTGDQITRETCHVDHAHPWTFRAIVDEFILRYRIDVATVPVAGQADGETEQSFEHPAMADAFSQFHKSLAQLRVVTKNANLSLLKKKASEDKPT